ncbi:MAG TPA: Vms1/Ankzf1 family peptidyl-tRNA hydrolase [Actinophytocola sp.]|uniref:baeRF2 domain-containing protein n=1 Tax=Actinophytocola sp. TaxID=1872138 RepID=UPI002DBCF23C|nr:Vms1/Ankzf1 family peptidyl-tRNA hydrolase [Actinophytocola sp.]HEU5470978.1 Vms1/Ankzf1 family peptidyl-tRNA hydrolase [Actinophytocola sp.]
MHTPGLAGPDRAEWGPVARLAPVLAWLRNRPPFVLVVTDRTGADLYTNAGGGQAPRTTSVLGPDDEIERNAPGGWAQSRYQNRAEDSWRHNAGAVADACEQALRTSGAKLLVISGDVRAVQLLEERLPAWVRGEATIQHITGGRGPDGSQPHRTDVVAEVIRSVAGAWTAELLSRFAEQLAPRGLAVDGELATLEAMAEGRVADLLVAPDPNDTRTAWFGTDPRQILPVTQNPPESWHRHDRGPLADLAIRAALLTGAQVHILDPHTAHAPAEGIGALCRFH